MHSENPFFLK